ncbi:MAG: hypothetical protein J6J11_09015 [Treponema sp.]|nr:hypothetical protein [Clostridia bacterium]MBP3608438.1 hypothetical protein [Treponema sp.]
MMNYKIEEETFTEAYLWLAKNLINQGVTKSPRGQAISHIQNCLFCVYHPGDMFDHPARPFQTKYLNKELELYTAGTLKASDFGEASKFWLKLANPDGTINSNYGYRVFHKPMLGMFGGNTQFKNQWDFAKQQLINDKDTRQALIFVSGPDVQFEGNKDFICTLNYIFNIEDNKLHLTVNRRSQDLLFGIPYDYVFEFLLMEKMLKELSSYYPDLKLGSYTMFANNVHIYERNFEIFKEIDKHSELTQALNIHDLVDKTVYDNLMNL